MPTARAARRSVVWSIGLIGGFYLMTIVLGFGAAALLGTRRRTGIRTPAGNTAVPLLSLELGGGADSTGGTVLFAVVAAVAFATILAVVAGITLASSASVAHDLYASLSTARQARAARWASPGSPLWASASPRSDSACSPSELNVAFLVGLAFAVAASANLPVLLYSLFWRRFTTRGAVWSVYGGLSGHRPRGAVTGRLRGPGVRSSPDVDFAVFPLENPGLVSIPLGSSRAGSAPSPRREAPDEAKHAETEVRSLTGAGAV